MLTWSVNKHVGKQRVQGNRYKRTFLLTPAGFLAPAIILQIVARCGRFVFGSLIIFRLLEIAVDEVVLTWVLAQRRARNNVRQPTTAGKSKRNGLPLSFSVQLITHMLKCV